MHSCLSSSTLILLLVIHLKASIHPSSIVSHPPSIILCHPFLVNTLIHPPHHSPAFTHQHYSPPSIIHHNNSSCHSPFSSRHYLLYSSIQSTITAIHLVEIDCLAFYLPTYSSFVVCVPLDPQTSRNIIGQNNQTFLYFCLLPTLASLSSTLSSTLLYLLFTLCSTIYFIFYFIFFVLYLLCPLLTFTAPGTLLDRVIKPALLFAFPFSARQCKVQCWFQF